VRFGEGDALALAAGVDTIISVRGSKVTRLSMKSRPSRAELVAALLGPSGNLRAPTVRRGRTLIVGFAPAVFDEEVVG
jgi:arsenate reductase-like glutaredoxin family protein